jgi:hypothetical protein
MAVRRTRLAAAAVAGAGLLAGAAQAQEGDPPDLEFLEYLGSWQETDEEWLIAAEMEDKDMDDTDKKRRRERNDQESQDDE